VVVGVDRQVLDFAVVEPVEELIDRVVRLGDIAVE
jgi:hypothetical protein